MHAYPLQEKEDKKRTVHTGTSGNEENTRISREFNSHARASIQP
jgi:hypothetical protein